MPDLHGAVLWRDICERYAVLRGRLLFVTGDTLSPAQRDRAGLRRRDLVAGGFERLTHHTGKLRLVVNDEHAALVHRAVHTRPRAQPATACVHARSSWA